MRSSLTPITLLAIFMCAITAQAQPASTFEPTTGEAELEAVKDLDGPARNAAGIPNVPDLICNPSTGDVSIDTDDSDMIRFTLKGGPFLFENADFSGLPAGIATATETEISWVSFNIGGGLVGTADLGRILPPGLSAAQYIERTRDGATYALSVVTGGGGPLELFAFVKPEPSSLALLGLGALALARRRKKTISRRMD